MRTLLRAALIFLIAMPGFAQTSSSASATQPALLRVTGEVEVKKRVDPEYPEAAQKQRTQGRAVLDFIVSENGKVEKVEAVSGDPLLLSAFSDAAMKWVFKPYKQNGHPIAFITRIGMDFLLIEGGADKKAGPLVELASPDMPAAGIQGLSPEVLALDPKIMQGHLVNRVAPLYPASARNNHISGSVHLRVIIGKDGRMRQITVIDGHPTLTQSAIDAVRQWRYSPYKVNGQPVAVQTIITVNFNLG